MANANDVSNSVISGNNFPMETLTSTQSGQWYANNLPVSGRTGNSYQIRIEDIGKTLKQATSNSIVCWHPRDVPQVKSCRIHTENVFTSADPNVPAAIGQTVRRYIDIINGYIADQSTGVGQPILSSTGLVFDGVNDSLNNGNTSSPEQSIFTNVGYGYIFAACVDTNPQAGGAAHTIASFKQVGSTATKAAIYSRNGTSSYAIQVKRLDEEGVRTLNISTPRNGWRVVNAELLLADDRINLRLDGVQEGTTGPITSGSFGSIPAERFSIGVHGTGTNPFPGTIPCVMVASGDTKISDSDRAKIERFLGLLCDPPKNLPL